MLLPERRARNRTLLAISMARVLKKSLCENLCLISFDILIAA